MLTMLILVLFQAPLTNAEPPFSGEIAQAAFQQLEARLVGENQVFWGKPLNAPMLLLDATTRFAAGNTSPGEGLFQPFGEIWIGRIPAGPDLTMPVLNWAGRSWAISHWPLAEAGPSRNRHMLGALWYPRARDLGLPLNPQANDHLQTVPGRVWMRLEWQALAKALQSSGLSQRAVVADALTFRHHRRDLSPNAPLQEQTAELVIGLAAYTGLKLGGEPQPRAWLLNQLSLAETDDDFSQTFAHWSGPAYGLLLDEHRPGWRQQLNINQDLGVLLELGMKLILPRAWYEAAGLRAESYRIGKIQRQETDRENRINQRLKNYRMQFVQGPVLAIPLSQTLPRSMRSQGVNLNTEGQILTNLTMEDRWGKLQANHGIRVDLMGNTLFLPLPFTQSSSESETHLQGNGWLLALVAGWHLAPGPRDGDMVITAEED